MRGCRYLRAVARTIFAARGLRRQLPNGCTRVEYHGECFVWRTCAFLNGATFLLECTTNSCRLLAVKLAHINGSATCRLLCTLSLKFDSIRGHRLSTRSLMCVRSRRWTPRTRSKAASRLQGSCLAVAAATALLKALYFIPQTRRVCWA